MKITREIKLATAFFEKLGFSVSWSYSQNVFKLFKAFWFTRNVNVSLHNHILKRFIESPGKFLQELDDKYGFSACIKQIQVQDKEIPTLFSYKQLSELKLHDSFTVEYSTPSLNDCWKGTDLESIWCNTSIKSDHIQLCFDLCCFDEPELQKLLMYPKAWELSPKIHIKPSSEQHLIKQARSQGEIKLMPCLIFYQWWKRNQAIA